MKIIHQNTMALAAGILLLCLTACQEKASNYHLINPAHIEPIEGSEFNKVELTEKAIERIDIKTGDVSEESISSDQPLVKVVPYSSLIYSPHGNVWVYTQTEHNVFVRQEVKVDFIKEEKAFLTEGPPSGTKVVSQGAAELYGTEYEVGH